MPEEKNNQKDKGCPLCRVSEESIDQLKKADQTNLYQCEECGFWYKEKEWAQKCEQWCKKHKSCNIEITKHALKRSN